MSSKIKLDVDLSATVSSGGAKVTKHLAPDEPDVHSSTTST